MNILVTGSGASGSWQIRGEQLGRAIGAKVQAKALDVAAFDLAVCVKRPPVDLVSRIHRAGVPLVYDVVDAWPQPNGNIWDREQCMTWLRGQIAAIRPFAIVAATGVMADDLAEFGVPVRHLPHHARPGLRPSEVRKVCRVAYEGSSKHLGAWAPWLSTECSRRGWQFTVNPPSLDGVDLLVALRELNGYAARSWKSNVKLANAQAAGIPIICAREAGYVETASGGEWFADTKAEVLEGFDGLTPACARRAASALMAAAAPKLDAVAQQYRSWLKSLSCVTAQSC